MPKPPREPKRRRKDIQPSATGRPPKLTPEIQTKVANAIRLGVPVQVAAAYGGISNALVYNLLNPKHPSHSPEFVDAIRQASAEAEVKLIAVIVEASKRSWQPAAWMLEHHPKYRQRWAKNSDLSALTNAKTS